MGYLLDDARVVEWRACCTGGAERVPAALRVGARGAIVECAAVVHFLECNEEGGCEVVSVRRVDLLEWLGPSVSVAQSDEDFRAVTDSLPGLSQAAVGRAGVAIIRALLGV